MTDDLYVAGVHRCGAPRFGIDAAAQSRGGPRPRCLVRTAPGALCHHHAARAANEPNSWLEQNTLGDVQMLCYVNGRSEPVHVHRIVTYVRGELHATWRNPTPGDRNAYWGLDA